MTARQIAPGIFAIGALDWDRELFDELIPLPDGTSYNSYLVQGSEKTALIDTVDPSKEHELIGNLDILEIEKLDYIVANHAEQDHSGAIPTILELHPEAQVVTNAKCQAMLQDLLLLDDDRFVVVEDSETLSLGDKTLQVIMFPWVHWPETMLTYAQEDKILFSCDLFGSHLATSQLETDADPQVYQAAKRYYAEIMMPFRQLISKNLSKVEVLKIAKIAPSHGPVFVKPSFIIDAYKDWISDQVKPEVILPFVSMHESTRVMVEYLVDALIERNIAVQPFNLTKADIGELALASVDAATIIIASPTVLTGAHPAAAYGAMLLNALKPKARWAGMIGSYGWGGKMIDQLTGLLGNLKLELLEPVLSKGYPRDEAFDALEKLADEIAARHTELDG